MWYAGLRGVAAIVFAIMAVLGGASTHSHLFNLVFCIVLLSISIQGTLLPWISARLSMIDHTGDVGKTFNDYQEESSIDFIKVHLDQSHPWTGQTLKDLLLPNDLLVVMIARSGQTIVPQGDTLLQAGDLLVIAARGFEDREQFSLQEVAVERGHRWQGKQLRDLNLPNHTLIILIKRGLDTIIPGGDTVILSGDLLVIAQSSPVPT